MPQSLPEYLVIDTLDTKLIPVSLLRLANIEWPDNKWPWWIKYQDNNAIKLASRGRDGLPMSCLRLLDIMASIDISELLGHDLAFPDLTLHGAGLHEIPPKGWLGTHLDSSHHPIMGWKRVASMVLCINERWDRTHGGALHVGEKTIHTEFGRLIVMATTDNSHHGVRTVTGPDSRKTLALFWWVKDDGAEQRRERHTFTTNNETGYV